MQMVSIKRSYRLNPPDSLTINLREYLIRPDKESVAQQSATKGYLLVQTHVMSEGNSEQNLHSGRQEPNTNAAP